MRFVEWVTWRRVPVGVVAGRPLVVSGVIGVLRAPQLLQ